MPVWELGCPDCGHRFRSLVIAGARVPPVWVCGRCGSRNAQPWTIYEDDPFSGSSGNTCGCGCC